MNIGELKAKLVSMTDEELAEFFIAFGQSGYDCSRESVVRCFVDHPEHERRMCQLLGLATEEEKRTTAAVDSARAGMSSSTSAWWSMACAAISVLISLAALAVAWWR